MARLEGIIRLRKWELDEKRRVLAALEEELAQIGAKITAVHKEVEEQKRAVSTLEVGASTLGGYMNGVKQRLDALDMELRAKNEEVEEQRDIVSEAFRELKKYEIAEDIALQREAAELDRAEQKELDEQGTQGFIKKTIADNQ